jgi:hypothetical protein
VKDWQILRRGEEPADFWSQSFTYGTTRFSPAKGPVLVRFSNDGGKKYRRVEAHLVYETKTNEASKVTFAWKNGDDPQLHTAAHSYNGVVENDSAWQLDAGQSVKTRWVEITTD